jgi:glycolate oxidase iron-sulfur subunit
MPSQPPIGASPRSLAGWHDIYTKSLDCVHCGMCLPACPTYLETGREQSSPRGRIYLMRGVAEGRIELGDLVRDEAYLCLGCRACETVCPSGVQYGAMVERTREEVSARVCAGTSWRGSSARCCATWCRTASASRSHSTCSGSRSACASIVRPRSCCPVGSAQRARSCRRSPPRHQRRAQPALLPARGERRGRVGFLTGCVMAELFPSTNAATLRVLAYNGFDGRDAARPGLLRRAAAHAGDADTARALGAAQPRRVRDVHVVITNSAGCGAALRDAATGCPTGGKSFAAKARDVCEWLDEVGLRPPTADRRARLLRRSRVISCTARGLGGAAATARGDPGARARPARRPGRVLRRRGHLQPDAARDVARGARAQARLTRGRPIPTSSSPAIRAA